MAKQIKVGVALSGGSAWGVAHVGALTALHNHNIPIDCIAGTSAGAVAAAPFAFGVPIEKIQEASKKLEWGQISRFAYSRLGVRSNAALATILRELLGDVNIEDAKLPLAIVATDIERGEEKIFRSGNVALAVCASSAIPGYFAPVEIDGTLYVDGAVTENLPISALRDMGATFYIGVDLAGKMSHARPRNLGEVVTRSLDVLSRSRDREVHKLVDVLIEPDMSAYDHRAFDEAEAMYREGFAAAEAAIPAITTALALKRAEGTGFWNRFRALITS
ncbi:MAG: patatin-like phospholipase family protein [Candidatus Pacebacteria bacterium]|nr:patatin-like phospholipase family protein [Candidatus Paceibacterota bacterium]